jgi:hypothetical protein
MDAATLDPWFFPSIDDYQMVSQPFRVISAGCLSPDISYLKLADFKSNISACIRG